MVRQFLVMMMNSTGVISHLVNTNNSDSARYIAEAIHPNYRVIEVMENK